MTTTDFTKELVQTLSQEYGNTLIKLADKSLHNGISEFAKTGVITLDLKEAYSREAIKNFREDLLQKGIKFSDFRSIVEGAESMLFDFLSQNGWIPNYNSSENFEPLITVAMPSVNQNN